MPSNHLALAVLPRKRVSNSCDINRSTREHVLARQQRIRFCVRKTKRQEVDPQIKQWSARDPDRSAPSFFFLRSDFTDQFVDLFIRENPAHYSPRGKIRRQQVSCSRGVWTPRGDVDVQTSGSHITKRTTYCSKWIPKQKLHSQHKA